jgi:hypothetical protein
MEPVRTFPRPGTICHPARNTADQAGGRGSPGRQLGPRRCPAVRGWRLSAHQAACQRPPRDRKDPIGCPRTGGCGATR